MAGPTGLSSHTPSRVGKLLRSEVAESPLRNPRQNCKQCHIRLGHRHIRPRRVGELLRIEVVEAPLHYPRQSCKQQRIRQGRRRTRLRRVGEPLYLEVAEAPLSLQMLKAMAHPTGPPSHTPTLCWRALVH